MDSLTFAYLAGAMDSDGYFSIKRSTYHIRVRGDAVNAVYSEKMGLHQVTPEIPELLKECFGGSMYLAAAQTPNSKPMYRWTATDTKAAQACEALLPYLRVKRKQAETLLELRQSKDAKYLHLSYWFLQEHPNWQELELITCVEAAAILGHTNIHSVSQAISNGTLLALPYKRPSSNGQPRIPRLLVERIKALQSKDGRCSTMPPPLIEWRQSLHDRIRELNKIGVNGTPIYHRTGHYAPAA